MNWNAAALIGIEYTWLLCSDFNKLDGISNQTLDAGWSVFDYIQSLRRYFSFVMQFCIYEEH